MRAAIVGLPRRLSGEEHEQSQAARRFADELGRLSGLQVYLQDERLSSVEAEQRLAVRERDWRARKRKLDAAAAAVILQDFIARPRGENAARPRDENDAPANVCGDSTPDAEEAGSGHHRRGHRAGHRRMVGARAHEPAASGVRRRGGVRRFAGRGRASRASPTRLAAAGVVPDAWTFRLAARIAGADRRLKAGEYRFTDARRRSTSSVGSSAATSSGDRSRFLRGSRSPRWRRSSSAAGSTTRDRSSGPRRTDRRSSAFDPDASTLEGYLFPTPTCFRAPPAARHRGRDGGRLRARVRRRTPRRGDGARR